MRMQICLQFKGAMEEINWNNMFVFKQNWIKNKKCNFDLELDFQHDKKVNI